MWQLQKAQCIGHSRSALAKLASELFLTETELFAQVVHGEGFFDRVQVLALQVLDEGDRERLLVGEVAHKDRHFAQPCQSAGPPASFTGDDLILLRFGAAHGPHQQRLQHALCPDGVGEFLKCTLIEVLAWLCRVGGQ